jgi:hypothetical protein
MQVTSDTLFHFTTSLNNLKGILKKKFQVTYCQEKYQLDYETHESFYPMVSFCDIPLSLTKDQIKSYGSYAIGMTKEWGIKNNLNPVVYVEKQSLLAKDIQATLDNSIKTAQEILSLTKKGATSAKKIATDSLENAKAYIKNATPENKASLLKEIDEGRLKIQSNLSDHQPLIESFFETTENNSNLFRYIKNYQGILSRNGKTFNNYRFYDEREWRFVPALNDKRLKKSLNAKEFNEYRENSHTKPFIANINLPFSSSDIKYLIVKSNNDIPKIIEAIRSTDNLTNNTKDADILSTKIMTIDQLNSDF